jgi:hypothetical protein
VADPRDLDRNLNSVSFLNKMTQSRGPMASSRVDTHRMENSVGPLDASAIIIIGRLSSHGNLRTQVRHDNQS